MTLEVLSADQAAAFDRDGFIVLPGRVGDQTLAAIRSEIANILENARGLTTSNDQLDLEDSHRPDAPRVRRIKQPHTHSAAIDSLVRSDAILAPVRDLLGPDLRLQNSKLNLKAAGYGAAVEWHQDWAFYPHTNDDVVAVGVMLDDVGPENAPLMMLPGSHKGPTHNHHADGYFCGAIDTAACGVDPAEAVPVLGPAGSISIHHVRMIHGSDLNRSDQDRALLLYEITAADAFPLAGSTSPMGSLEEFDSRMLCGETTITPRLRDVPVRLPQPQPPTVGSIYEVQRGLAGRSFARAE